MTDAKGIRRVPLARYLPAAVFMAFTLAFAVAATAAVNVRDFGAKGDGVTKDTTAIQAAIDATAKAGGGEVRVPPGRYISGTLHLRSNVTLYLESGATLAESPDDADFDRYEKLPFKSVSDVETTYFHYGLVTADGAHNIAIIGQGIIDGNRTHRHGPKTVALKLCKYVTIEGITVENSPNYSISLWGCDYVNILGVTVLNGYADGIDPDSSRYVRIANCYVDSEDDAICPKASPSMGYARPTEHLTVTNCVLRTNSNNIKFGTESSGDFKDVAVSNLVMLPRAKGRPPHSGISLESVDGAHIDGVVVSNISMQGVTTPIFVRLGNRGRGVAHPVPGTIRNVSIQNVIATGATKASDISGLPGHPIEDISLEGINVTAAGGTQEAKGINVPEFPAKYPEEGMFGELPAYALYVRHARDVILNDLRVRSTQADARPPIGFDDVRGLSLDGFRAVTVAPAQPAIWMNDVVDALVRGSSTATSGAFLRVSGAQSGEIKLEGNDFTDLRRKIEFQGASKSSVRETGNFTRGGAK